jgi:thymidylate synthase
MRIYDNFVEALNEIRRDVSEMGILVHAKSWQNIQVGDNEAFKSLELQNYTYQVLNTDLSKLNPVQPWADAEWLERQAGIYGIAVNPGAAWKLREEVWNQFLEGADTETFGELRFGYTYSERFAFRDQVQKVIDRIKVDPDSRQLFISVWNPNDIENLGGISRVPCTLGYMLQIRQGKLNITYLQRSADLVTHFENDLFLACKLQEFIAMQTGYPIGTFTHWIASLHMFRKDAKGVF